MVEELSSFAATQHVDLIFESTIQELQPADEFEKEFLEIRLLLRRIITFTPDFHSVKICIDPYNINKKGCVLRIENTGMDLSKVGEILETVTKNLKIVRRVRGTQFILPIPIKSNSSDSCMPESPNSLLPKQYPMYFTAVKKRLSNHFLDVQNDEETAIWGKRKEHVFLKKVNTIIHANISDPEFKVDALASEMALSRTQLFRKVKSLTKKSPQHYLRFVRLEEARRMLRAKDKGMNVSEVCYKVGFTSRSHFTRSFQNEFGFNPSQCMETEM